MMQRKNLNLIMIIVNTEFDVKDNGYVNSYNYIRN